MNSLQLTNLKTGIDDFAVELGDDFSSVFNTMLEKAINPLRDILKTRDEINTRLASKDKIPKLDIDKLTPQCREYLEITSNATCCSDQILIVAYLATAGACLRKAVQVQGPVNWLYPNTWNIVLGKSGSAKTTGANMAVSLLHNLDKPLEEDWFERMREYEFELSKYEDELKKIKKEGGQYDDIQEPGYPKKNTISYPIIASLERYYEILSRESSSGLINTSEEMAVWFQNLRKVDILKEFLTCCYGGKVPPNMVSFKNARNLNVDNPIISILGPSTPDWIFNNFSFEDYRSGFFQRILWTVNSTEKERKPFPEKLSRDQELSLERRLDSLYKMSLSHGDSSIKVDLSDEVRDYFEHKVFKDLEKRKSNFQNDIIISCLDRYWNEYLFKYALILHCLKPNWMSQEAIIDLDTFKAAEVLIQYFEKTLLYILDEIENSKAVNLAQKIVDKLRRSPEYKLKHKDLADKLRGYDRNRDEFYGAVEFLREKEVIEIVKRKSNSNNESKTEWIHLLEK